jgi:hypothetical protein
MMPAASVDEKPLGLTNISEDFTEWSYLASLSQEDRKKLDDQIGVMRELSAPLETIPLNINSIARLGTGAALTNNVNKEFLDTYGATDLYDEARGRYFKEQSKLRYWGDTDVRGCYLVVLESGDALSAVHLPFNAAEDAESLERQLNRLSIPISSTGATSTKIHIAGGFEEPASKDTLASLTHYLAKTFQEVEIGTLDVLNREQGARMPVFDTETKKMYEAALV